MVENLGETGCPGCERTTALIQDAEQIFRLLLPHALDGRPLPKVERWPLYPAFTAAELERAFDGLTAWGAELRARRQCCDKSDLRQAGRECDVVIMWCANCGMLAQPNWPGGPRHFQKYTP